MPSPGVFAAIAGLVVMSRANSAKADYGSSYLLLAVLIAVLGGVNPYGGYGRVDRGGAGGALHAVPVLGAQHARGLELRPRADLGGAAPPRHGGERRDAGRACAPGRAPPWSPACNPRPERRHDEEDPEPPRRLCRRDARRARRRPSRALPPAWGQPPGDRAGDAGAGGQGRHRLGRRLGAPADLHRLRRDGAARRLRHRRRLRLAHRPSRWPTRSAPRTRARACCGSTATTAAT